MLKLSNPAHDLLVKPGKLSASAKRRRVFCFKLAFELTLVLTVAAGIGNIIFPEVH